MGYSFKIKGGLRIKDDRKSYPWPCESAPDRTISITRADVLTKACNGKYMKHTGLGCFNIVIPDDDLEPIGEDVDLTII